MEFKVMLIHPEIKSDPFEEDQKSQSHPNCPSIEQGAPEKHIVAAKSQNSIIVAVKK